MRWLYDYLNSMWAIVRALNPKPTENIYVAGTIPSLYQIVSISFVIFRDKHPIPGVATIGNQDNRLAHFAIIFRCQDLS